MEAQAKAKVHAATIFQSLDTPFHNFAEKNEKWNQDPPIWYKSTDQLVSTTHELLIPVTAGSIVKYQFSTNGGDILFSSTFLETIDIDVDANDSADENENEKEVICPPTRVASDTEPQTGQFKCVSKRGGSFTLLFDNQYVCIASL